MAGYGRVSAEPTLASFLPKNPHLLAMGRRKIEIQPITVRLVTDDNTSS